MPLKIPRKKATKSVLLKSSPGPIPQKYRGVSFIVALNSFALWDLRQRNIAAVSFSLHAPYTSLENFHAAIDRHYKKLCRNASKKPEFDYAQLFKNHICWEMQASYFFLRTLDVLIQKHGIKKVILESLPVSPVKKYSKDINELIGLYCRNY